MIKHIGGGNVYISNNADEIAAADRLILPGVGHFLHGMQQLYHLGLVDALKKEVFVNKKPILGICLGMQLLTQHSEEGGVDGLGFIAAQTKKFKFDNPNLKVPHMGWNAVHVQKESPIIANISEDPRYYFVHSYYVECVNQQDVLFTTEYGHTFVSGFQHNNTYGLQFHPEKSHKFGMELLANFCKM
jgi:glutamine amidotransferase